MLVAREDIPLSVRHHPGTIPDAWPAHGVRRDTRSFVIEVIMRMDIGPKWRRRPVSVKAMGYMSPTGRIVEGRAPPTTVPATPTPVETEIEPVVAKVKSETPAIPGCIDHVETPAPGSWIIVVAKPGVIIKTSAVQIITNAVSPVSIIFPPFQNKKAP